MTVSINESWRKDISSYSTLSQDSETGHVGTLCIYQRRADLHHYLILCAYREPSPSLPNIRTYSQPYSIVILEQLEDS